MNIEAFEKKEQLLKLKTRLSMTEQSRLSKEPTVSLEDARKRLEKKYKNAGYK